MSETIFQITEKVLTESGKYSSSDGKLLRNLVLENAEKMDKDLLSVLIKNEETKKAYFTEVDGFQIFDKVKFSWIIQNKEFLPDSYTRYKNKIGLTNSRGEFISASNDVELVFPYKDCILEGGQTKEDQKNNEIFYNETLAPDQVSNLLAPKAFCNAKKYDKDGVQEVTEISDSDNLIIKGNNLLALSSLLEKYRGKVKTVFIDPPYFFSTNKQSDTFLYNSNFKLSTWLDFMKNRLCIAKKLLKKTGVLFITLSDEGNHYLKLLADEIYGMRNFIADICWECRKSISSDGLISMNTNHILVYANDINSINKNSFRYELNIEDFPYDDNDGKGKYRLEPFDAPGIRKNLSYKIINPNTNEIYFPPNGRCWRTEEKNYLLFLKEGKIRFGINGNSKPQYKAYYNEVKNAGKGKAASTLFHDINGSIIWENLDTNTNATKELLKLGLNFSNPKPEDLIERIFELSTEKEDVILDFFLGSGTTAAVAHKMHRQYIGIDQMDYIETITCERLKKVIAGDQTGISKSQNWQSGGSFIYCELAKLNQNFVDKIQACKTDTEIKSVTEEILKSDFVSSKVKPSDINTNAKDYSELTFEEKQQLAMALLDKNQLYVNFSERKDPDMKLSSNDIKFTESFYGAKK